MNNLYQEHIFIKGRVQGVGFRTSTRRKAREIGITGWVRNKRDGSVEVIAEGPKKGLLELREFLSEGPSRAQVNKIEINEKNKITERNFSDFKIEY